LATVQCEVLHLLRALQRHAMVPEVVICGAAYCGCEDSSGTSRNNFTQASCGAEPLRRR